MEAITEEHYRLPSVVNLGKCLEGKKPLRVWTFRRAYLALLHNYWMYAVAQVRQTQDYHAQPDKLFNVEADINDFEQKLMSCSIASYAMMRICIRASRALAENALQGGASDESIEELRKLQEGFARKAGEIIDTRNDLGAHPERAEKIFTGSLSFSSGDERITFTSTNLYSFKINERERELKPSEHLLQLRNYIDELTLQLSRCWGLS